MSRWNIKIKKEQHDLIKKMAEENSTAKQIAKEIGVTVNAIRWHVRQHGISLRKEKPANSWNPKAKPEYGNYSKLPKSVLFDAKNFPEI